MKRALAQEHVTLRVCREIAATSLTDFCDKDQHLACLDWAQWCREMALAALEEDESQIQALLRQRDGMA